MRVALLHLSDIHLRDKHNPISARAEQLVAAANSEEARIDVLIIVVSGDVAFSGEDSEYANARAFLSALREEFIRLRPGLWIEQVTVPGNHDCVLPESQVSVRDALIGGVLHSFQGDQPDGGLLEAVLQAQSGYWKFEGGEGRALALRDKVCRSVVVEYEGKRIQLNLYNTAILSRLKEEQGKLRLPMGLIHKNMQTTSDAALSVSVFHHSYVWLDANIVTQFRAHIEASSDVVLMGHQHAQHGFDKQNLTGQRVLYFEAGALQDAAYPASSSFHLILFDLDGKLYKPVHFKWSEDMYRRAEPQEWREFSASRRNSSDFWLSKDFQAYLDDPGMLFIHRLKDNLKLRDIFIYPDIEVRTSGPKPKTKEFRGESIKRFVVETPRIVLQGSPQSGKTALCKILFQDLLVDSEFVPLLVQGRQIKDTTESRVTKTFWREFEKQYARPDLEKFQQLNIEKKALLIDDWDKVGLNTEGRRKYLDLAGRYFGKIILFTGSFFQVLEAVSKSTETLLEFNFAMIQQMSHTARGKLIDRWITTGREDTLRDAERAREIEETEKLVLSVIGRSTLPSLPFIVLCILEADQEDKAESAEAGSFGYLYEVVITTALNTSTGRKTQLEKKYVLLAQIAYEMFKTDAVSISETRVKELAGEYSRSHLIKVDFDSMMTDLEQARVLINASSNYSFGYPHLFSYFVARYYKENLDRPGFEHLRSEIHDLVDAASSDKHASILMFLLYFSRHTTELVSDLVERANAIYAKEKPTDLDSDVEFLNKYCDGNEIKIPDEIDLNESRRRRREAKDEAEKNLRALANPGDRTFTYSDDLDEADKLHLAGRHIFLLGQVLRNFPGTLPGDEKLLILRSVYLLGLRQLRSMFRFFRTSINVFEEAIGRAVKEAKPGSELDIVTVRRLVDNLVVILNAVVAVGTFLEIAYSVGLPDLEAAYSEILQSLGLTNGIRLIDLAIRLEHFEGFPEDKVKQLHRAFSKNPFATTVLKGLVLTHMQKFHVNPRIRQSIASMFKVAHNTPQLIDPSRKRD